MEFTILQLLRPENIITSLSAPDAKTSIQQLSELLIKSRCVVDGFADDVWRRELLFPTGLPTIPHGVAIPHADPDHVLKSALAIGILNKPVQFDQMASDHTEKVQARIIFLIAVTEKEKQISTLQEIIDLIKFPGLIEKLLSTAAPSDVLDAIVETIKF